jgi:hypothetical protein
VTIATPVFANIAFLRIARFDAKAVVEQAGLKERLEARVRAALEGIPPADRIVLDAADGIAVVLFGEPVRALDLAQSLRAAQGEEAVHVGVNHGPIAVTSRDASAKVFGDGITAAAAAAGFAGPGRILVTAPFARMLEATRPDRAAELAPAGEFTDSRVRLHAFYTPEPRRRIERLTRLTTYALSGIFIILMLGVAARSVMNHYFPPRPAVVEFDVRPRGEVWIDGVSHGRSPPVREVEVPPGRHRIEVRNGKSRPLEINVKLEPGERMTVSHAFGAEAAPQKPGSFWRDLRRNLGL